MIKDELNQTEQIVLQAIHDGRGVQKFLWKELSLTHYPYEVNADIWAAVFQKRVDKIKQINFNHPNASVELRKRLLQQATLSIQALLVLDNICEGQSA